jgi:hypothetical protein
MGGLMVVEEEVISSLTEAQTVMANEKLNVARDMRDQMEQMWWDFGEVLFEIYEGALYQAQGYESWQQYVQDALDISYSSARNAVNTYRWLQKFDQPFRNWVHKLGATKAALMEGRFGPEDADVWQNRLDGLTCRQMEDILRGKNPELPEYNSALVSGTTQVLGVDYGADGYDDGMPPHVQDALEGTDDEADPVAPIRDLPPDVDQAEVLHFSLFPEQRRNVAQALAHAKQLAQTDKSGHALDLICTAYLAGDGGFESEVEYLAHMERVLGKRLVAFNRDMTIAYGDETFDLVVDRD